MQRAIQSWRDGSRAQEEGLLLLLYRLTLTVIRSHPNLTLIRGYVIFRSRVFLGGTVRLIFAPRFQTGFHQRLAVLFVGWLLELRSFTKLLLFTNDK